MPPNSPVGASQPWLAGDFELADIGLPLTAIQVRQRKSAVEEWVELLLVDGKPLPEGTERMRFSGKFVERMRSRRWQEVRA